VVNEGLVTSFIKSRRSESLEGLGGWIRVVWSCFLSRRRKFIQRRSEGDGSATQQIVYAQILLSELGQRSPK
jgi:hypothetical protein